MKEQIDPFLSYLLTLGNCPLEDVRDKIYEKYNEIRYGGDKGQPEK